MSPFLLLALAPTPQGHEVPGVPAGKAAKANDDCCKFDPVTGEGVSLGGFLFPEINYQAAAGSSTADPARLAVGHHDPDRHGITQQNVEFTLGVHLGEHLELFGNYNAKIDREDHWVGESEEHYATLRDFLPLQATLKGGRFFTEFGYHNREHLHDYTFIDKYLANGRMIGEDSATVYGGELSLPVLKRVLPLKWSDRLTFSYGAVPDPLEEGEELNEVEALYEAERATWQDWLASVDFTMTHTISEAERCQFGVSGAWGKNNFHRHTQVYGTHFEYLSRPAGVGNADACCATDGASFLRWRAELLLRHFGAVGEGEGGGSDTNADSFGPEEESEIRSVLRDEFTDAGFYTAVSYGLPRWNVQAHLRAEYVSGVSGAGLPERWRVSPTVTWHPSERLPVHFKLQYNYDHLADLGDEHSFWAQLSFTWGDCCSHDG
ncbi:MAG TPA: hypothetical protein VFG14_07300 [Chthoniobacteraceae bacterium]|nr:hypothetical protein [Chthoniobacteraceae bacterium]